MVYKEGRGEIRDILLVIEFLSIYNRSKIENGREAMDERTYRRGRRWKEKLARMKT